MKRCYRCGSEWRSEKKHPSFKEYCEQCSAYFHCCTNCHYYDRHAHNGCSISTTDWVSDKEGPNLCDDYSFVDTTGDAGRADEAGSSVNEFDTLFGGELSDAEPRKNHDFDSLFGKD